ncbi:MAG TPA: acyltransferase [Chitinispirillaceae bacterium]|nr:acyltransferase [Chitinispirillaceae bacterium]
MADNTIKTSPKYFRSIDGLRLLASINIVLLHLEGIGGLNNLNGTPGWLFKLIKGPAFHASIFFLLGGFIFTIKFTSQAQNFKTLPFLRKRFSELFPLHIITTVTMIIMFVIRYGANEDFNLIKLIYSSLIHLSLLYSFFPFFSYTLNTPSWALSAFFLCYLLFGPALRLVVSINKKRLSLTLAFFSCMPVLLWGLLYGVLGTPEKLYHFFHMFAPIRFFEFLTGMLLARFYQLSNRPKSFTSALFSDLISILSLWSIYKLLSFHTVDPSLNSYLAYHFYVLPFYFVLLYIMAAEQGIISRILGLSFIRNIGKCSFYPYLLHIPLITLITFAFEKGFGYYSFLHSPTNVIIFMLLLYGLSAVYVNKFRKKRTPLALPQKQQIKEKQIANT